LHPDVPGPDLIGTLPWDQNQLGQTMTQPALAISSRRVCDRPRDRGPAAIAATISQTLSLWPEISTSHASSPIGRIPISDPHVWRTHDTGRPRAFAIALKATDQLIGAGGRDGSSEGCVPLATAKIQRPGIGWAALPASWLWPCRRHRDQASRPLLVPTTLLRSCFFC
jgi:hypothetical protein